MFSLGYLPVLYTLGIYLEPFLPGLYLLLSFFLLFILFLETTLRLKPIQSKLYQSHSPVRSYHAELALVPPHQSALN